MRNRPRHRDAKLRLLRLRRLPALGCQHKHRRPSRPQQSIVQHGYFPTIRQGIHRERTPVPHTSGNREPAIRSLPVPIHADRAIPCRLHQWRHLLSHPVSRAQPRALKGSITSASKRREPSARHAAIHSTTHVIPYPLPTYFAHTSMAQNLF